jgi:AcrR family transcriptional regulator
MPTKIDPRIERNRAAILQGAQALLKEEGWEALTQERVAARAGVGRTTVYRHWPDRMALLMDALDAMGAPMHQKPTGDLRTDLVGELDRFRVMISERTQGRLLATLAYHGCTDADIGTFKERLTARHTALLHEAISRSLQSGELLTDVEPNESVAALMGPLCYRFFLSGEPVTADFVERVVDRFLAQHAARQRVCCDRGLAESGA